MKRNQIFLCLVALLFSVCGIRVTLHQKSLMNDENSETLDEYHEIEKSNKELNLTCSNNGIHRSLFIDKKELYLGHITIGTPPQKFEVIFDTLQPEMWVLSNNVDLNDPNFCRNHNTFERRLSKTYEMTRISFNIAIFGENYIGKLVEDNVGIAGAEIEKQYFAAINCLNGLKEYVSDGVFGLGMASILIDGVFPPFYNMYLGNMLDKPVFALWLNSNKDSYPSGEILFGDIDHRRYIGEITYTPCIHNREKRWLIKMDSLIGETNICRKECQGFLASSISYIRVPRLQLQIINDIIGAKRSCNKREKNIFLVECDTVSILPDFSFHINGRRFPLKSEYYIIKKVSSTGKERCESIFRETKLSNWMLGTHFMRKFYTIYDIGFNRVGVAESI